MNNIQKLENKTVKWYMKRIDIPNEEFISQRKMMRKHCKKVSQLYSNYFLGLKSEKEIWDGTLERL